MKLRLLMPALGTLSVVTVLFVSLSACSSSKVKPLQLGDCNTNCIDIPPGETSDASIRRDAASQPSDAAAKSDSQTSGDAQTASDGGLDSASDADLDATSPLRD